MTMAVRHMQDYPGQDTEGPDEHDTSKRVVGLTDSGNKIYIVLLPHGKYKVKMFEGGVLPVMLRGQYSTYREAERDVKLYLEVKQIVKEGRSGWQPKKEPAVLLKEKETVSRKTKKEAESKRKSTDK